MKNKTSLVSVIIPCYNQGQYIDDAVNSVLNQTYDNFEIIIVNDGSTNPETIDILKNYNQPKTKVIHTDNQGLASARNNGIEMATGKYILPLDADDKIGDTYLEKAVNLLEDDQDLGIVYCEAELFGSKTGKWELAEYKFPDILLDNVIFCSGFFRKSDWELVQGYKANMIYGWEDYDFWLSIINLGRKVYRIPQVLFFYRQVNNSMTKALTRDKFIYSYTQLFKNNQELYCNNIEFIFTEIIDLRDGKNIQKFHFLTKLKHRFPHIWEFFKNLAVKSKLLK
jgi:glycosyltransferase involved in cell wall biosynthesis